MGGVSVFIDSEGGITLPQGYAKNSGSLLRTFIISKEKAKIKWKMKRTPNQTAQSNTYRGFSCFQAQSSMFLYKFSVYRGAFRGRVVRQEQCTIIPVLM